MTHSHLSTKINRKSQHFLSTDSPSLPKPHCTVRIVQQTQSIAHTFICTLHTYGADIDFRVLAPFHQSSLSLLWYLGAFTHPSKSPVEIVFRADECFSWPFNATKDDSHRHRTGAANSTTTKSSQRERNQANYQRLRLLLNFLPSVFSVGPCALEYTKMKTADHFWTDPSADELVQRHRIHGGHCRQDSPTKRPALCVSANKRRNGRLPLSSRTVIGTRCSAALGLSGSTTLITVLDRSREKKQLIISVQKSEFVNFISAVVH